MLGMVVHACNLSTQEAEAGGFLHSVQGNPGLQSELQDSQSYTEKPCLKKTNKQKKPKKQKTKKPKNKKQTNKRKLHKTTRKFLKSWFCDLFYSLSLIFDIFNLLGGSRLSNKNYPEY